MLLGKAEGESFGRGKEKQGGHLPHRHVPEGTEDKHHPVGGLQGRTSFQIKKVKESSLGEQMEDTED